MRTWFSFLLLTASGLSALVFVAVSMTMNALFLSSLGRTATEAALLSAVSIAADVVKAVLPVVLARAIFLRAWAHAAISALMLAVVIGLSLASGTGYAALTRGGVTAARVAQAEQLAVHERDLRDLEDRFAVLSQSRAVGVIDADLSLAMIDRRWLASASCAEITTNAARKFCADVFKLRTELATARERDRLTAERSVTRARIETLRAAGAASESDPQAIAIATLLGIDAVSPRRAMTVVLAVVLELGSVILILLVAGPELQGWREPGSIPAPPAVPASVPVQADRSHWQRQRDKAKLTSERAVSDAR